MYVCDYAIMWSKYYLITQYLKPILFINTVYFKILPLVALR